MLFMTECNRFNGTKLLQDDYGRNGVGTKLLYFYPPLYIFIIPDTFLLQSDNQVKICVIVEG